MTEGMRIKEIRKQLNLSMKQFGARLGGVSKQTISNIENGNRNATEHMEKSICREFNVNEEWLRNGTGEPFVHYTRNEEIRQFIDEIEMAGSDDFRNRLVSVLSHLTESEWDFLAKVAARMVADDNFRPAEGSPESVAAAEAAYEKALDIVPPTGSSVSSTGDEEKQEA